jgi:hypothetical protein
MFIADLAYRFIVGVGTRNSLAQAPQVAQLTKDEKECYDKIVNDLRRCCVKRFEHPSLADQDNHHIYAIIFRQTESWQEVDNQLINIEASTTDFAIIQWVKKWKDSIGRMRLCHHQINAYLKQLEQSLEDDIQLSLHSSLQFSTNEGEARSNRIKTLLAGQIRELWNCLAKCRTELDQDLQNPKLTNSGDCQNLLNFLQSKWLHLTVFAEWMNVPMDEKKLCVQIRHPNKEIVTADEKKMSEKEGKVCIELDKHVNESTKAIFLIEVNDEEKPLKYDGIKEGKIVRPTEINIQQKCFGDASDSPVRRKRSSSSSLQVTNEILFDFIVDSEYDSKKSLHAMKQKEKAVTSMAHRLQGIVELALGQLNKELANGQSFSWDNENKGNGETPDTHYRQSSWPLFSFKIIRPFL